MKNKNFIIACITSIFVLIYNLIIICITCYMCLNSSIVWIILLLFTGFPKIKEGDENENKS